MERQNFEDSWKKAFEDAGLEPSGNVWTNIELDLEKARGSQLKRKLLFFQMLAAASVIFALGVGVGVFVIEKDQSSPSLQLASNSGKPESKPTTISSEAQNVNPDDNAGNSEISQTSKKSSVTKQRSDRPVTSPDVNGFVATEKVSTVDQYAASEEYNMVILPELGEDDLMHANFALPALVGQPRIALHIEEEKKVEDPVALMMARLDAREKQIRAAEEKKENRKSEKLWTSVGIAAGSYTPMNVGTNSQSFANQPARTSALNTSIANQEAKASGLTYSVGANVGTRVSNRWVLQGGVNYLTQTADYTAHNAVSSDENFTSFRPASINELKKLNDDEIPSDEKVVATAPYNVNNNIRYVSIPLQAGFMLINRNFGLQLNAGASTDLFLQNTVTAEGVNLDKSSSQQGESSPYRSVNVSGLMGTEVSYRFSKHYRISLNPGVRYPFSSIYRSAVDVKATPLTFDVGLRFRYIFH